MTPGTCLLFIFVISFYAINLESHPNKLLARSTNQINATEENYLDYIKKIYIGSNDDFILESTTEADNTTDNCSEGSDDEDDFPQLFSGKTVRKGGLVIVILIAIYGFSLLACVCNYYFLPCVETICERLNLTPDVAAATFMSIATSTPEFFTNMIGTFITVSDLGIGTIVGSSLYNALGVPAVGGLATPTILQLDWYPLTRDCIIYSISVSILVTITWDGEIYWYETLFPLAIYILYFVIMFNNKRISKYVRKFVNRNKVEVDKNNEKPSTAGISTFSQIASPKSSIDEDKPKTSIMSAYGSYMNELSKPESEVEHIKVLQAIEEEDTKEAKKSLFRRPEGNCFKKFLFYYLWPIKLIFKLTTPNPKIHPRWYLLTFIMCIVWIGLTSYLISWMISIIGELTKLPDALLGMTLMAVGGCLPETVSMTIIARRGEGAFGVSNSLGANTMNVLYSLGLPWLLKNAVNGMKISKPVKIQSGSIQFTILSLIIVVFVLFLILFLRKFRLSRSTGVILGVAYIIAVTFAILSQTVFFKPNC